MPVVNHIGRYSAYSVNIMLTLISYEISNNEHFQLMYWMIQKIHTSTSYSTY